MRIPRVITVAFFALSALANVGNASESDADLSLISIVVEREGALGVGMGSSTGLKVLSVCDVGKVNSDTIADALQMSMSDADITFDPPGLDNLLAVKIGEKWKTIPELLSSVDIEKYNVAAAAADFRLPPEYSYQVSYSGLFEVTEASRIRLWLQAELFKGRSRSERQVYTGPYSGAYLRDRFVGRILTRVRELAECQ